jgi:hypothetical protein
MGTPDAERCAATIWPSYANRWIPCPGRLVRGRCTAYGEQHNTANTKINLSVNPQVASVPVSNLEDPVDDEPVISLTLNVQVPAQDAPHVLARLATMLGEVSSGWSFHTATLTAFPVTDDEAPDGDGDQ